MRPKKKCDQIMCSCDQLRKLVAKVRPVGRMSLEPCYWSEWLPSTVWLPTFIKISSFVSIGGENSYRYETTGVKDDRISIFGWTVSLMHQKYIFFFHFIIGFIIKNFFLLILSWRKAKPYTVKNKTRNYYFSSYFKISHLIQCVICHLFVVNCEM